MQALELTNNALRRKLLEGQVHRFHQRSRITDPHEIAGAVGREWAQGGRLYWNGLSLEKIDSPGCFLLTIEKELLHSAPCAN